MNVIKVIWEKDIPKGFTGRVEFKDGEVWILENGLFHRENGPAFFSKYGPKHWFKEGIRHRIDGPAIEWSYGFKDWYVEGREYFPSEIMDYFNRFPFLEKEEDKHGLIWLKFLTDRGIEKYPFISRMEEGIASEYLEMIK